MALNRWRANPVNTKLILTVSAISQWLRNRGNIMYHTHAHTHTCRGEWALFPSCRQLYLSSFSDTHTHTHTHTRVRAYTHAHCNCMVAGSVELKKRYQTKVPCQIFFFLISGCVCRQISMDLHLKLHALSGVCIAAWHSHFSTNKLEFAPHFSV